VEALGLSFTVSILALAGSLFFDGVFHESLAGTSLLPLAPALIGMFVGQRLRNRVRPAMFRRCLLDSTRGGSNPRRPN
jgi:uncharacterized protein